MFSSLPIALRAIASNRLRSGLTMLGVMIGIAAVIALQAIGEGQKAAQMEIYELMGANKIMVFPGWGRHRGVSGASADLELEDAGAILQIPSIANVSPITGVQGRLKYLANTMQTQVVGVLPEFFEIENYDLKWGRGLEASEVTGWSRVVVLGPALSDDLFGQRNPVGEEVKINGKAFEVIGVTVEKGALPWYSPDEQAYVPLTTVQRKLGAGDNIQQITAQARNSAESEEAEEAIKTLLQQRHPAYARNEELFQVFNAAEMQRQREAASKVIQTFLVVVGAISLFIGGIGIMNIMLVTVSERTREIGLRKALGATPAAILGQFLTEAVVLCVMAGLMGVGAGIGISSLIAKSAEKLQFPTPIIEQSAIVIAFCVAVAVGIFFGTTPAIKASRLEPMRALRHE